MLRVLTLASLSAASAYYLPMSKVAPQNSISKISMSTYAEYLAMRSGAVVPTAPAAAPQVAKATPAVAKAIPTYVDPAATFDGKGFGGGEATRDPAPTYIDPNDQKGKQQAIHKAETFAEYLAKRNGAAAAPAAAPEPAPAAPVAAQVEYKEPELTSAQRMEIARVKVNQEAAEDAAMPPLPAGIQVHFACPEEPWLDGRMGTLRAYDHVDSHSGKYYVWLPAPPNGSEDTLTRPVIGLFRRSYLHPA